MLPRGDVNKAAEAGFRAGEGIEERLPVAADRGLLVARARAVAILVGAGLAASGLVLAVTVAPAGGGLAWTVLGAAAAVVALAVVARGARR